MTDQEPSYGDTGVPDTFSADQPQDEAQLVEDSNGSSEQTDSAVETPAEDDFDIDLGTESYRSSSDDDLSINLDFGGTSTEAAEPADQDIDLDFGAAAEPEAEEPAEVEEHDAGAEALQTFRTELRTKPGEWYVVHTYSGMENRVMKNLENRVSSLNMEDYIYEIIVPTEEVTEIR